MLKRWIKDKLEQTMRHTPAVALLGPRQVGKTTLAQTITESRSSLYLDLENPEDLLKLSDPSAFLSLHGDKLVIVDEIQRLPDLFMILRGLIDRNRRNGRKWRAISSFGVSVYGFAQAILRESGRTH